MESLRFGREIRWLFQAALLIFLVTIGLGMGRGIGLIDFSDRNQLLTHLHSGALGWVTTGFLAAALWLYGGTSPRQGDETYVSRTTLLLVVAVPLYVVAWWTGNLPFRAASGALVLLGIVLFVWWLVREASRIGLGNLTTPQLGTVVGLTALVVGSSLGVLLQVGSATGTTLVPGIGVGAHAEAQVAAYLVLVAMSLVYWRLRGDDRTRAGTWMVSLLFTGGAIVSVALLANSIMGTIILIPLHLIAIGILLRLVWRRVVAPGWLMAGPARHFAVAIPFALVYYAVFIVLIGGFLAGAWTDVDEIPPNLFPAAVHPLFVGMATNINLGLLLELNRDRRALWPWADHVIFWGVSGAVAIFTLAILLGATDAFKFITPVLGGSILLAIVMHTLRLRS